MFVTSDDLGLDRQFILRQAQCLAGNIFRQTTTELKDHTTRANYGYPKLDVPFTFTHTGFGRSLGDGLIWENTDPDFTAAFHATHSRAPGSLELAGGQPAWL